MTIKIKNTCNISYPCEEERAKALQKQYRVALMRLMNHEEKKQEVLHTDECSNLFETVN